jgi:hypothetical protein
VLEAEKSPLFEAVATERLVKTADWKRLMGAALIFQVWGLKVAL